MRKNNKIGLTVQLGREKDDKQEEGETGEGEGGRIIIIIITIKTIRGTTRQKKGKIRLREE